MTDDGQVTESDEWGPVRIEWQVEVDRVGLVTMYAHISSSGNLHSSGVSVPREVIERLYRAHDLRTEAKHVQCGQCLGTGVGPAWEDEGNCRGCTKGRVLTWAERTKWREDGKL